MNESLKKFINLADWAKKQTVEILDVIGKLIQFKSAGWICHDTAGRYLSIFSADIERRMSCLLGTLMNLGTKTINIGPFKDVLDAYYNADDYLVVHMSDNIYFFDEKISRNNLEVLYRDVSMNFAKLRDAIDELVRDIKKETRTE